MRAARVERVARPLGPAHRAFHGGRLHLAGRGGWDKLVERHDDVRSQQPLNLHRAFGAQHVAGAVEVRLEDDPLLAALGEVGQAHHLIAATVGEDRAAPAHEAVQAAQPIDPLGTGAQHEVIGVAKNDVSARCAYILGLHRLDRGGGAHGHEGGGANLAALHGDRTGARLAVGGVDGEGETGHRRPMRC